MGSQAEVLRLDGEIDLHQSQRVRDLLAPLIAGQDWRVLVDFGEVSYLDSSGLVVLIEALQRGEACGGRIVLCGLRPSLHQIFELARLDQVFEIFADQEAAAQALESRL